MLIDPCDPQSIPICDTDEGICCTTRWQQVVVDNNILQTQFSDRARAVRLLGDFIVVWDLGIPATQDEIYDRMSAAFGDLYVQLIKRPINSSGNAELPPDIWDSTSVIEGYSESKALKTWWYHWNPLDGFSVGPGIAQFAGTIQQQQIVQRFEDCAGNPVGLWGSLATGTGTIGAGASPCGPLTPPVSPVKLGATCFPCPTDISPIVSASNQSFLKHPRTFHMKFDIRKRISLREDEQLNLDFQLRSQYSSFFSGGAMIMLSGGIKTLLEY